MVSQTGDRSKFRSRCACCKESLSAAVNGRLREIKQHPNWTQNAWNARDHNKVLSKIERRRISSVWLAGLATNFMWNLQTEDPSSRVRVISGWNCRFVCAGEDGQVEKPVLLATLLPPSATQRYWHIHHPTTRRLQIRLPRRVRRLSSSSSPSFVRNKK